MDCQSVFTERVYTVWKAGTRKDSGDSRDGGQATGTLTFQTSTTGQPATSSFATGAAGRSVPGGKSGLGSALAGLVAALFFL